MLVNLGERLKHEKLRLLLSGFGVGLSWGSAYLETDKIVCPDLMEI
jgi:3-oxoacyl-[acyl-carrier-protein] synthase-3